MFKTSKKISTLVKTHFPDHIVEEFPAFIDFIEAYYEWTEEHKQVTNVLKTLSRNQDIDTASFGSLVAILSSGSGTYVPGEIVYQGVNISTAIAKGVVFEYEDGRLEIANPIGKFNTGFGHIKGLESGASYLLQDIDYITATLNDFVRWFKSEFIPSIPTEIISNPKQLIKRVKQFYRAKGTQKSYRLLFRILFNEEMEFYYPWRDLFRASDAKWIQPRTLRVTSVTGNPFQLIGKRIRGSSSFANAFVENVITLTVGTSTVYELFLNRISISGNFIPTEQISEVDGTIVARISPIVIDIDFTNRGEGFVLGDFIEFDAISGSGAKAKITSIDSNGAIQGIEIINFGALYDVSVPPNIIFPPSTVPAMGTSVLGSLSTYPGYFLNDDGMTNTTKYLQDGYFYQQFSYVLKVNQSIDQYRDIVKKLVHPAGLIFFSELLNILEFDLSSNLADEQPCAWIEIVRQQFIDPKPFDELGDFESQQYPLYADHLSVENDSSFIKIERSQNHVFGHLYEDFDNLKWQHLPYEGFEAFSEIMMSGDNEDYWNFWANYQYANIGHFIYEDFINKAKEQIDVIPEPRIRTELGCTSFPDWNTVIDNDSSMTFTIESQSPFTLPIAAGGDTYQHDFVVDWGDNTFNHITSYDDPNATHDYAAPGPYTVRIIGTCEYLRFGTDLTSATRMRTIDNFDGDIGLKVLNFQGCTNLTFITPTIGNLNNLINVASFLRDCSTITTIPSTLFSNNPNITNMANIFWGCNSLQEIPEDLFRYNPLVTTFRYAFRDCSSLTELPVDLFRYNTAVTDFGYTFRGCSGLTDIPEDLFRYNPLVTTFHYAFFGCSGLTAIPEDLFAYNVNVVKFTWVFTDCINIQSIPEGLFRNCPLVQEFSWVFTNCRSITSLPTDLFRYNPLVTHFDYVFYNCHNLVNIPSDLFKYNVNVETFFAAFYLCDSLQTIPTDLFRYNVNVTDFSNAFGVCYALQNVPVDLFRYNVNVQKFFRCFYYCVSLQNIPTDLFRYNVNVTLLNQVFYQCFNLQTVPSDLFRYNINTTTFASCFCDCLQLELHENIFYADGEQSTRFLNQTVNFTECFYRTNYYGLQGTAPDAWTCDYGTGSPISTNCFAGAGNNSSSLTNYNIIPVAWGGPYVADWTNADYSDLLDLIDPLQPSTNDVSFIGNISGDRKWAGGVLAPNGYIYGIPYSSESILKIDPTDDSYTTFGSLAGTSKWWGGVLASNGIIYGIPFASSQILKIDPATDTISFLEAGTIPFALGKFKGAVVAPNGCIYCIPFDSPQVMKIDPTDDSITFFGNFSDQSEAQKWDGGVLAPNGYIYGMPNRRTEVLLIDPLNDTVHNFGDCNQLLIDVEEGTVTTINDKWSGGVLTLDQKIFAIPHNAKRALIIDTANLNEVTLSGTNLGRTGFGEGTEYAGGAVAPTNIAYAVPYSHYKYLTINSGSTTETSIVANASSARRWIGAVLAPNGCIYGIPNKQTSILKINTNNPVDINFCLSKYFNKY